MGLLVVVAFIIIVWMLRDPLARLIDRLSTLVIKSKAKEVLLEFERQCIKKGSISAHEKDRDSP